MKIPRLAIDRELLYGELIEKCFASVDDRKSRYATLRNWYLYGNENKATPVEYNKLFSHIDLLASFLFSGDTTAFSIQIPKDSESYSEFEIQKASILVEPLNEVWHDSNADIVFNEALILALVYDTAFVKIVPLVNGQFMCFAVEPQDIGVLREDVPYLVGQEAIAHRYFMSESELRRRVKDFSPERKALILSCLKEDERPEQEDQALPVGVQKLVLSATSPTIKGELASQQISYNFGPSIQEKGVDCYELWVWDDDLGDYRTVTMVDGEWMLYDAEKNNFVNGELPFVKVTPNMMNAYFWGRSELMYLIPLQAWVNERIPQLKELMGMQVKPPTQMQGFSGLTEEKYAAFMRAGGFFTGTEPAGMTRIEQFKPNVSNDIFMELRTIEDMFNEVSGIREIMRGGGETNVRAFGHADLLARLGSSRAKKKAFILEDAVEKTAENLLQAMRKFDKRRYLTEKGTIFIAGQLTENAIVKVDAHSSSPIFMEALMEKAQFLFEAGAIDKMDLLDAVSYPNAGMVKLRLKKRLQEEAALVREQALIEAQAGAEKGGANA